MNLPAASVPAILDCRRVYVAGPMSGRPEFNYPAFQEATSALRRLDLDVRSPHENEGNAFDRPYDWYLRRAIAKLIECDGVALLDGWEESRGARLEHEIATACAMRIAPVGEWLAVLREAWG